METIALEPLKKLNRDMSRAATLLTPAEARFLVDAYYMMQDQRIRTSNQIRSMDDEEKPEPHQVLDWFFEQSEVLENQVKNALHVYAKGNPLGAWALSICGVGPVISAGLLAHINCRVPTVGHVWSFAGLDIGAVWIGGQAAEKVVLALIERRKHVEQAELIEMAHKMEACPKWLARRVRRVCTNQEIPFGNWERMSDESYVALMLEGIRPKREAIVAAVSKRPWNADLKTLCWKMGECFVKVSSNEADIYGKAYAARKAFEIEKNANRDYADQAGRILKKKPSHKQKATYAEGILPDGHIHMRAKRYAVKMFLSHYHAVGHFLATGNLPPRPYAVEHLGHAHVIAPPNMGMIPGMAEAWDRREGGN